MSDYSKNIYCETWETADGYRIDIGFTWYEMKKMPYEYRYEKRKGIFEKHGFDYTHSCKIREWFFDKDANIQMWED